MKLYTKQCEVRKDKEYWTLGICHLDKHGTVLVLIDDYTFQTLELTLNLRQIKPIPLFKHRRPPI